VAINCNISSCSYNDNGVCHMYDEERTDEIRTIEFYEKWNPKMLPPKPKMKREGDM